jgi:DNA-binding LacI/PurR family transcriptional regulator
VLRRVTQHEPRWSFTTAPEAAGLSIRDLAKWSGDGILAASTTAEEAAIGALAAEHLVRRGFQNFAFYGPWKVEFSEGRKSGFVARLAEASFKLGGFAPRNCCTACWRASHSPTLKR